MDRFITQRELRNDSGGVMRAVEAGEVLVVTRRGVPIAELRPLRRRAFVPRGEIAGAATGLPALDATRFRSDVDAAVDQSTTHER